MENSIDNNKFNLIELKKKENPLENFISDKPSYIENKPSILESFKPTPVSLPTTNNFLETDILQRINILNSLLNPLSFFAWAFFLVWMTILKLFFWAYFKLYFFNKFGLNMEKRYYLFNMKKILIYYINYLVN